MNKEARKKSIARRAVLYPIITVATVVIALSLGLYTFGFRFDIGLNKVERTGLVQFGSSPSGSISRVDGDAVQFRTPNKAVINAGKHDFSMERDKYHDWKKSLTIKPGMIRWLNYAILVPKELKTEAMIEYEQLSGMLATPEKKDLMILKDETIPQFELVDIRGSELKSKPIDIPATLYSESTTPEVSHRFEMMSWDEGGRYLLVKHFYADSSEWLVLDSQNPAASQNLSTHFDIVMTAVYFADTSGNKFYTLNNTDIRRLDLAGSTISHPIVTRVESFQLYDKNYITYIGQSGQNETARRVVGTYRDGDKSPHIVKSFAIDQSDIKVAMTKYFNEDYIAIINNKVLTLLKGNFPADGNSTTTLKSSMVLSLEEAVSEMSFSKSGQYLLMRSGESFVSYDLEYQGVARFAIESVGDRGNMGWLNSTHLWAASDSKLSLREFDGQNSHLITNVAPGFEAVFTNNKKYIYSISNTPDGKHSLQRSVMIL